MNHSNQGVTTQPAAAERLCPDTREPLLFGGSRWVRRSWRCVWACALIGAAFGVLSGVAVSPGWAQEADEEEVDVNLIEELVLTGEYDEAEEALEETELDLPLTLWKARLLRETGRLTEAIQLLEERGKTDPKSVELLALRGGLRAEVGKHADAAKDLRAALALDSQHIEARTRLGVLLIDMGRRPEGRANLRKIIEYYKGLSSAQARATTPETYVWMGRACVGLNRYQEAYKVMYESALDLDEECALAHLESGRIMLSKYNYPDARSHFKDAIAANPNFAEAHIGLAQATMVDYGFPGSRFQAARTSLDTADRIWADHPETLLLRGYLAFYDENWSLAATYYRKAIDANPRNQVARAQLAAVYYCMPDLEAFAKAEQEMARLHPAPAAFYTSLAERLVDRFFYKEGVEYARKAIALDPEYWPAYVIRGINALRIGEEEEGRNWAKRAFESDPFNVWAFNTLQLVKHMDKRFTVVKDEDFVFRVRQDDADFFLPYLEPLLRDARESMEKRYQVQVHRPITVEAFSRHQYFSARSIGLPGLAASGVCFGRMVTLTTPRALPGNWGSVAIHEFMHVVSLGKTGHRIPRWFTEGLSVMEEGRERPRWTRRYADEFVDAVHSGGILPMARIQGAFTKPEYPGQILLAYYQGGVICEYIEKRWNFAKLIEMLRAYRDGKNTEQVFRETLSMSLSDFDRDFLQHCRELAQGFGIYAGYSPAQVEPLRFHLEDNPEDGASWVKLGLAYMFTGKITDAELAIGRAKKLGHESGDLHALIGMVKMQQGKTSGAIEALQKAIDGGTNYRYRARVALGYLLNAEKERDRAAQLLQEAIDIHPDGVRGRFGQPNPYYVLADILYAQEKEEEAVAILERLVRVALDDLDVRKRLASYYRIREEWDKLVLALEDGPFIDPFDIEVHQLLAQGYVEAEAYGPALRELTILLAYDDPALEKIYPEIAWCHYKLGDNEKALDFAKRAVSMAPKNERALEVLEKLGGEEK